VGASVAMQDDDVSSRTFIAQCTTGLVVKDCISHPYKPAGKTALNNNLCMQAPMAMRNSKSPCG
jgi:hypothetical protein